jgi:hypothetical protein
MAGRCRGRCTYASRGYHTADAKHDDAPGGLPARGIALCGAGTCGCAGLSVSWRGVADAGDASPREYRRYHRVYCPVRSSNAAGPLRASAVSSGISQDPARRSSVATAARASEMPARRVGSCPSRAMFTERWRSASARRSRKRASDTWCFSAISDPNMAVDVSPGVIPIRRHRFLGARGPASRSQPGSWLESHGRCHSSLRRCMCPDWDLSDAGSGSHAFGLPPIRAASPRHPPGQGDRCRGQTKTPDLQEARGARIAQRKGQPTMRQTPGHRVIDTAKRACSKFTGCLLPTMTRIADPASFPWCLGDPRPHGQVVSP